MEKKGFNVKSLKNLAQYKDLSDEEFDKTVSKLLHEETRILAQEYFAEFQKDYILDDLKYNDKIALEILCWLYAQVRINQEKIAELQSVDNLKPVKSLVVDNTNLIKSITSLEDQLAISRIARMKEEGTDVVDMVASLREKAKDFLEKKLHYIFCPKCNMLLATLWVLYRNTDNAYECTFICKREEKGKICNTEVKVRPGDLSLETSRAIRQIKPEDVVYESSGEAD